MLLTFLFVLDINYDESRRTLKVSGSDTLKIEDLESKPKVFEAQFLEIEGQISVSAHCFTRFSALQNASISGQAIIYDRAFAGLTNLQDVVLTGVESIGEAIFVNCSKLEHVRFDAVKFDAIEKQTFYGCSALKAIELPDSITSIKEAAFARCSSLTSVKLPANAQKLTFETDAFNSCPCLENMDFHQSKVSLGSFSLKGCGFKEINIEYISEMGVNVFHDNANLEKVKIGYVKILPASVFHGLKQLKEVVISSGLLSIGNHAFTYCSSLEKLEIPDSVNQIGGNCFQGCYMLKFTKLPNSLVVISANAFIDTGFERIELPDNVETIESLAFLNNSKLTSISFGASVKNLDASAFTYCPLVSEIKVSEKNKLFFALDSILFKRINETNELVMFPVANAMHTLQLDQYNVSAIGPYAFFQAKINSIVAVTSNINSIGQYAFFKSNLTAFTFNGDITTIPEYCFANSLLQAIDIPSRVTKISKFAFYNCNKLLNVKVEESVKIIEESAFESTNIQDIELPGVVEIGSNAFANGYTNFITFGPKLTTIGDGAFTGLYRITNISLPDSVVELPNNAFRNCNQLEFFSCGSLTSIGDYCFEFCYKLRFTIPKNCSYIGVCAFKHCHVFTELNFYSNMTIYWGAFDSCRIKEVTFNGPVTSLSKDAFKNCANLKTVKFIGEVYKAFSNPFENCSIENVYYCGTIPFNASSFSDTTNIYVTSDYKGSKFAGKVPKVTTIEFCPQPSGPTPVPSSSSSISPTQYIPTITPTQYVPTIAPTQYVPTIAPTQYVPTIAPTQYVPTIAPTQYIPTVSSSSSSSAATIKPASKFTKTQIIIFASAGGGFLLIVLIIVIFCICKRRKEKNSEILTESILTQIL